MIGVYPTSVSALTTGANNISIGLNSLRGITSGSGNIAIGTSIAMSASGAESNIIIGNTSAVAFAGLNNTTNIYLGHLIAGTNTESQTLRLGKTDGSLAQRQNRCFIAGIRDTTTGLNDAVAVLIDSAGQLGTISSSAKLKENIKPMAESTDKLFELRPVTFNYIADATKRREYGLIAEEVKEIYPELVVDLQDGLSTVKYHLLAPMLLNVVQKQNKQLDEQKMHLNKLQQKLDELEKKINSN